MMKSNGMVRLLSLLLLVFCSGLMSCSNSDTPADSNPNAAENEQGSGNDQAGMEDINTEQSNITVDVQIEGFYGPIADLMERAISVDELTLEVTLNDQPIPMQFNSNFWTGSISVKRDSRIAVDVLWSENYAEASLRLAQADLIQDVSDQDLILIVNSDSYDFNFDEDGDGVSNLDERRNNTNPFDSASN